MCRVCSMLFHVMHAKVLLLPTLFIRFQKWLRHFLVAVESLIRCFISTKNKFSLEFQTMQHVLCTSLEKSPQTNPIIGRIDRKSGHGAGRPTKKLVMWGLRDALR